MEHRPLVDLQTLAHLSPAEPRRPMSRAERIERWIEALERPQAQGSTLGARVLSRTGTDHIPGDRTTGDRGRLSE
jgi:hypothetical protein